MGYYYSYLYLKKLRHREIKKIPKVTQLQMESLKMNPGSLNLGCVLSRTTGISRVWLKNGQANSRLFMGSHQVS